MAAPVSHIWYFRGVPSKIGLLLDMSPKSLEQVIYFAAYVVLDPGTTGLEYKQVINDKQLRDLEETMGDSSVTGLKVGMGAEAIRELLMAVDLEKESKETRDIIETNASGPKRVKAIKRIEIIEAFRKSGNRPEWMILTVLPVIPPDLRPMVQLDGGRFASSDLNDLYRRVINRNNRLKRMIELSAPEMIIKNEKRMLQEAVDALIDNGRRGKPLSGSSTTAAAASRSPAPPTASSSRSPASFAVSRAASVRTSSASVSTIPAVRSSSSAPNSRSISAAFRRRWPSSSSSPSS